MSVCLDLDEHGRLTISSEDGSPLDTRLEQKLRQAERASLEAWLVDRCNSINAPFEQLLTIHAGSPPPVRSYALPSEHATAPEPAMPVLAPGDWWERVLPWRKNARLLKHEQGLASYQRDHHLWEAARSLQLADWERRRRRSEVERFTSVDVMHELLAEALGNVAWPRETSVNAEISPNLLTLCTEVDLPEIEDLPTTEAVVAERGLKLNLHERSAAQIRKAYAIHIHGIIFRVIGESFSTLPTLTTIISSGFSQRPDADSGHVRDEYLLSVRVSRDQWAGLDFSNLSQVDPVAALARFALRSECTASGRMSPIVPWPATA